MSKNESSVLQTSMMNGYSPFETRVCVPFRSLFPPLPVRRINEMTIHHVCLDGLLRPYERASLLGTSGRTWLIPGRRHLSLYASYAWLLCYVGRGQSVAPSGCLRPVRGASRGDRCMLHISLRIVRGYGVILVVDLRKYSAWLWMVGWTNR